MATRLTAVYYPVLVDACVPTGMDYIRYHRPYRSADGAAREAIDAQTRLNKLGYDISIAVLHKFVHGQHPKFA